MLVYSVIDRASFECVRNLFKYCRDRTSASVVFMLIGNKCDKEEERSVSVEEAQKFAGEFKQYTMLHCSIIDSYSVLLGRFSNIGIDNNFFIVGFYL